MAGIAVLVSCAREGGEFRALARTTVLRLIAARTAAGEPMDRALAAELGVSPRHARRLLAALNGGPEPRVLLTPEERKERRYARTAAWKRDRHARRAA